MRMHLKPLTAAAAAALLLFQAPAAASLDDAFKKLNGSMAYQEGGAFATATRYGYALPGMSMRFQTNTYSLVQIEPPQLEIGCHGIDAHLGSLSFINGEQMEKLLKEVSNSLGMLFLLALKNMCGPCSTALEWAQRAAQIANNLSIDTCEMAKGIMASAKGGVAEIGKSVGCSVIGTTVTNEADEWLASRQRLCADRKRSAEKTREGLDLGTEGDRIENADLDGNSTWKVMQAHGLAPKNENDKSVSPVVAELFLSWFGTTLRDEHDNVYRSRITDASQFLSIFMCGSDAVNDEELDKAIGKAIENVCGDFWKSSGELEFYKCVSLFGEDRYEECRALGLQKLSDSKLGEGFLIKVVKLLNDAVDRAASNQPLTSEQESLIASAPFPLYQGINIASTHPAIGRNLVMSYSVILAHHIGVEYIKHVMREAGMNSADSPIPVELAKTLAEQQAKLVVAVDKVVDNISVYANVHRVFMEVVNRIQQDMVKSARSSGIAGFSFARDLAAAEGSTP